MLFRNLRRGLAPTFVLLCRIYTVTYVVVVPLSDSVTNSGQITGTFSARVIERETEWTYVGKHGREEVRDAHQPERGRNLSYCYIHSVLGSYDS